MHRVVFLIGDSDTLVDGNYLRFANVLFKRGHEVALCFMEEIGMVKSRVSAPGFGMEKPLLPGAAFPDRQRHFLDEFEVVWIMALGKRHSFLDRMQLLYTCQDKCRIINSLDAVMHFKSKYFTASHADVFQHPDTWASNNPRELFEIMGAEGGTFVAKPPASSFGRNVFLLTESDPNAHVILESLCGPDEDEYCLLQRYVENVRHGEKRVLLAGGVPVGQYERVANRDHRTNVLQGAHTRCTDLSAEEDAYCRRIGARIMEYGAEFVGMDLCYPWVIEFNVINPGGILTIEQLGGGDLSGRVLDNVFRDIG